MIRNEHEAFTAMKQLFQSIELLEARPDLVSLVCNMSTMFDMGSRLFELAPRLHDEEMKRFASEHMNRMASLSEMEV